MLEEYFSQHDSLVTPLWLRLVWEFTQHLQLLLYILTIATPQSPITNDVIILGKDINLKILNKVELRAINWVRMHLKVIFISDLISDSSIIINHNFRVEFMHKQRRSVSQWEELDPYKRERDTWMKLINIIIDTRGMILHSMGFNRRCIRNLGRTRHKLASEPFNIPNEKQIKQNVTFKNESLFLQALLNKKTYLFC